MPTPKFSVVIPTCRREKLLARCLGSLQPGTQLAPPELYEVIVADDAKGDTAEAMIRRDFPWVRWVQGPARGPAANRNTGSRLARGEWICFIDDDCSASKRWLAVLNASCTDPDIDMIEGRTKVPLKPDSPFAHAIHNHSGGIFWTCNLAVRRTRYEELGGFDEDFQEPASEDMEFAHRYHAHKFRSKFIRRALVYHPVRMVGWRSVWHRVLMIRWNALYLYKVDDGNLHLADSPAKNVARAAKDMVLNSLRQTKQDLMRWNKSYWKERWFTFTLRWVTFPYVLPYYLYWVHRFYGQLKAKRNDAGA